MNDKTNATRPAHRLNFCVHWGTYVFLETSIRCNARFINRISQQIKVLYHDKNTVQY